MTIFVAFLFSIIVSLLFCLRQERQAFENASLSAELREAGRGFFKGGRKGGVWERVRSQHEAPQAARNLSHHRTLRGLRVIFPHFVGIMPSLPRTQLNSFMGTETSWFP